MEIDQLKRVMKSRHLTMLSLGGVIGTGLFLTSGYTIGQAGPGGAIVSYLVAGLLCYLVMNCLGELSMVMPVSGSFQAQAARFVGPATGFAVGWTYWINWGVTIGAEFTAAGILMQHWFPSSPVWIWSTVFVVLLFSINMLSAKGFAETEFWFSSIKVMTVVIFIVIGLGAMFGAVSIGDKPAPYLNNLFSDGGLFPNGFTSILITIVAAAYAFQGAEVLGIAAGETKDPEKNIPKAIRTVALRIGFFYILAMFVLASLVPWRQAGLLESPFVTVFQLTGIPYAADIMNFVILTALLSVGNSGLYASSRMLFAMSQSGMAPATFGKADKRGVPTRALIATLCFAFLSLLTSFIAADTVFMLLVSIAAIATTFTWLIIPLAQYNFRKQFMKSGGKVEDLKFSVSLFPLTPLLCIVLCIGMLASALLDPTQRLSIYIGAVGVALCYLYYYVRYTRIGETPSILKSAADWTPELAEKNPQ
ncbi:amino acid permease [Pseudomonas sp. NPDC088444]|uniref:amino acid permease n=1 Tax=Pseudomonas sp. NPDC088444 TaxID=3364456 RepID=UPI00384DFA9F